jgi:predicted DNA-binding transcriptional regulator AlpA
MKGDVMTSIELLPIREQLDRIEKKLDGNFSNKFLSINQVSRLVSLSSSTIRRAVTKGELKCSRKIGKLLFQEFDVRRWLNG